MALNTNVAGTTIHVGDLIRVHYRVIEKETVAGKTKRAVEEKQRERIQPFEGLVIAIKGIKENQSFIVRRIGVHAIGIERIFPVISPWIKKIEIKTRGKVRRSKLYYLRGRIGKKALKVKEFEPKTKRKRKNDSVRVKSKPKKTRTIKKTAALKKKPTGKPRAKKQS